MDFDNRLFAVADNVVYEVVLSESLQSASLVTLGTIGTNSGNLSWARNPTQIMIVDGSTKGYIITPSSSSSSATLSTITDPDFFGGSTVVFVDSYFVYNPPNTSYMAASQINDGTDYNALDIVTAEGRPDKLVALLVDKREIWALGEKSVEIWYNTANAVGFPFSRRDGAFIDQGCSAAGSAISIDNTMMWLDDRRYVVMLNQYSPLVVSTPAINAEFQKYVTVSDAQAYQYFDRGHLFYVINFPSENKTWAYDLSTQQWHEKASVAPNGVLTNHLITCRARSQGVEVVGGWLSGKIFRQHHTLFSHVDQEIPRIRRTPFFRNDNKQISISSLELEMETGFDTTVTPQIMLRYSNDGGHNWSDESWREGGDTGEYQQRVIWNRLGAARNWQFEFKIVCPVDFAIIGASAEFLPGSF
jgi:hypothetical protein